MNLEESEEEAEGGEGLQGTSPAEMLSGCCRTPGAFLLCHGEVWKDAQQPLRRAKKIGVVCGPQEGMPAGASLGCGLAIDPRGRPSLEGLWHPLPILAPHLSLTSSSKKEGDGMHQAVAKKTFPLLCAIP